MPNYSFRNYCPANDGIIGDLQDDGSVKVFNPHEEAMRAWLLGLLTHAMHEHCNKPVKDKGA